MSLASSFDSHLHGPVLVIGAGLLGASLGLGLRHRGYTVYISDISPTTEAVAEDIGAGTSLRALAQEWQNQQDQQDQQGGSGLELSPQLVVVAAPPDVTAELVAKALADYPAAFVIDIASVKAGILESLEQGGADTSRYLGTHPMAGREKSGPVAARGELFSARPWVLCDHDRVRPELLKVAQQLASELGSIISHMDVFEHDRTVALISHLPQVMSSLLASRLQDTPLYALGLAGQGLRDTTRIAASDPGLWVQILAANAQPLVQSLYGVQEDLARLIATLEDPLAPGARLDIAQLMAEGNAGVGRIPGKHGGSPSAFAQLTVLVDDAPGTLARLLQEIGELGVNLEDLRLEHSPGAQVGMAEISVNPNEHEKLIEDLTSRGWKVVR